MDPDKAKLVARRGRKAADLKRPRWPSYRRMMPLACSAFLFILRSTTGRKKTNIVDGVYAKEERMFKLRRYFKLLGSKCFMSLSVFSIVFMARFAFASGPQVSIALQDPNSSITTTNNTSKPEDIKNELTSKPTYTYFSYGIYLGYEGTSTADINNKNTTRVQVMSYNHIIKPEKSSNFFKGWGLDGFVNIILTSVTSSATTTTSTTSNVSQAVGGDLNLYLNKAIGDNTYDKDYLSWGPIVSFGGLKPNSSNEMVRSEMYGLRLGYNQESFLDILYGKREGVEGHRAEIRGQIPISEFKIFKNPLIVGINIDIGVENTPANNLDNVKVYVMWKVPDIGQIFTSSFQGEKPSSGGGKGGS